MSNQTVEPRKLAKLSFRLLPEQRAKLDAIAKFEGVTLSDLMRPAIESVIAAAAKN